MKRLSLILAFALLVPCAVVHAEEGAETQALPPLSTSALPTASAPHDTLCEPTTLAFCAQTVVIDRASTLGSVLQLQTDKGEAVEVRCVKDEEDMLAYEIKDAGSIICPYY